MEQAGQGLARIMEELLRVAPAGEAPLLAWPAICGAAVAGRTRALQFTGGVLRVQVPDNGWRLQLAQLEPQYLRGFELWLGKGKVRKVDFVVAA
jgi:hypothetical protein